MYILDANVYISACKGYYGFDLVPGFWKFLTQQSILGKVRTIDKVREEILKVDDELTQWIKKCDGEMFEKCDRPEAIYEYQKVQSWAQAHKQFTHSAKSQFASGADAWLIAYAKAYGHTIVTHERSSSDSKKRILIPNACQAFSVPCENPFKIFKDLGATF